MPQPPAPDFEGDLPRLVLQTPGDGLPQLFAVGDEVRLSVTALNEGGASTGVSVIAWGSALSEAAVVLDRFELLCGNIREGARHIELTPVHRPSTAGEALWVADAPEAVIAPSTPAATIAPSTAKSAHNIVDAWARRTVHVNAVGRAARPGAGGLFVALVPMAHRDGAAATTWDVAIDPPLPRPLRCAPPPGSGAHSHQLRAVAGDRYLYALVALGGSREEGVALACRALDDAVAVLGDGGRVGTAVFRTERGAKPRAGQGKLAGALKGARFEKLRAAMRDELTVTFTASDEAPTPDPRGFERREPRWGMAYGTSLLPDREQERAPTLQLWVDARALGAEKTAALRARWAELVADAMAQGGLQGVLFRCDGAMTSWIEHSPYEVACSTSGPIATTRAWLTRWVRVPGNDTLWMGDELAARVGDDARERLRAVAEVTVAAGGGLRVTLREPGAWAALELALADVLATAADAQEASRAWYAPLRAERAATIR